LIYFGWVVVFVFIFFVGWDVVWLVSVSDVDCDDLSDFVCMWVWVFVEWGVVVLFEVVVVDGVVEWLLCICWGEWMIIDVCYIG